VEQARWYLQGKTNFRHKTPSIDAVTNSSHLISRSPS
jgi:hypothetical protein